MSGMKLINYQGELLNSEVPFLKDNRAFRYGDSLFETIRIINGAPHNLGSHINRLFSGAKILSYNIPSHYTEDFFRAEIGKMLQANEVELGAKIRLHLFRAGGGAFRSESDEVNYLITGEKLPTNEFVLNNEGLSIDVFNEVKKERSILSNLKTGNSLLYIMAMNEAKKKGLDEICIMNQNQVIIEASQSNIFLVSNGVLYTPPLSDGCVGGTMRMNLINLALENKVTVYESSLSPQNLLVADEIILTNAIKGVQWVGAFRGKRYYNKMARTLVDYLNGVNLVNSDLGLQENLKSS
ncbi:aminotransferase class IV [Parvicella tangerina]|uniref:branched-chain-amino-acid transaminase n=1 Tax=Parvicella tangerina TaxID=2829795 RepID=A0A916NAI2_9FLAO|nr:aminotransferase class IV [Parvicella tangerina]CAG5080780.1 D-alanine aminotransferase [Parvicella tangerina]